jgi:hypothetical protein
MTALLGPRRGGRRTTAQPWYSVARPALQARNGNATPGTLDPGDHWTYTCEVQTHAGQTRVDNVGAASAGDGSGHDASAEDTVTTTLTQPPAPAPPAQPTPPATTPATPAQPVVTQRTLPAKHVSRGPAVVRPKFTG